MGRRRWVCSREEPTRVWQVLQRWMPSGQPMVRRCAQLFVACQDEWMGGGREEGRKGGREEGCDFASLARWSLHSNEHRTTAEQNSATRPSQAQSHKVMAHGSPPTRTLVLFITASTLLFQLYLFSALGTLSPSLSSAIGDEEGEWRVKLEAIQSLLVMGRLWTLSSAGIAAVGLYGISKVCLSCCVHQGPCADRENAGPTSPPPPDNTASVPIRLWRPPPPRPRSLHLPLVPLQHDLLRGPRHVGTVVLVRHLRLDRRGMRGTVVLSRPLRARIRRCHHARESLGGIPDVELLQRDHEASEAQGIEY
jgi:hypothetical protein